MELKAFTTMLTQLGDLRVACGPMEITTGLHAYSL